MLDIRVYITDTILNVQNLYKNNLLISVQEVVRSRHLVMCAMRYERNVTANLFF